MVNEIKQIYDVTANFIQNHPYQCAFICYFIAQTTLGVGVLINSLTQRRMNKHMKKTLDKVLSNSDSSSN